MEEEAEIIRESNMAEILARCDRALQEADHMLQQVSGEEAPAVVVVSAEDPIEAAMAESGISYTGLLEEDFDECLLYAPPEPSCVKRMPADSTVPREEADTTSSSSESVCKSVPGDSTDSDEEAEKILNYARLQTSLIAKRKEESKRRLQQIRAARPRIASFGPDEVHSHNELVKAMQALRMLADKVYASGGYLNKGSTGGRRPPVNKKAYLGVCKALVTAFLDVTPIDKVAIASRRLFPGQRLGFTALRSTLLTETHTLLSRVCFDRKLFYYFFDKYIAKQLATVD